MMSRRPSHRTSRSIVVVAAASAILPACTSTERAAPPPERAPALQAAPQTPPRPAPAASFSGPVLDGGGACTGPAPPVAGTIEPGIGECDLVRLKGKPPTDVLVGEGRAGREVQVLYTEPGAKELYFFVNNRLDRVVKS